MYPTRAPHTARYQPPRAPSATALQRQEHEARALVDQATRFGLAHPDVMAWLEANERTEYGASLSDYLCRKGYLTEAQVAAVRAKLAPPAASVAISVGRIEEAFVKARAAGLSRLKMHLDTFEFKPAKETSRNAGGIYVTEDGEYLGKVMDGRFLKVRACTKDQQARIVAAASDPATAAKAYGQRTGRCSICGRELTAEESIERFVGPICADKYGF